MPPKPHRKWQRKLQRRQEHTKDQRKAARRLDRARRRIPARRILEPLWVVRARAAAEEGDDGDTL